MDLKQVCLENEEIANDIKNLGKFVESYFKDSEIISALKDVFLEDNPSAWYSESTLFAISHIMKKTPFYYKALKRV